MKQSLPPNRRVAPESERPSSPGATSVDSSFRAAGPRSGSGKQLVKGRRRRAVGRWLARFRLITGIIVVVSASLLVAWGLRRYLRTSPRFAIKTVQVDGNVRRSAQQLAARAKVELGKNIFAVDLSAARQAVVADEWIETATVTRTLPSTIRIQVSEREAQAVASVGTKLFLVDSKGNIFKQVRAGDPIDLPVITGLDPVAIARDREGVTLRLRRVLDLLADLQQVGIDRRFPVQEVHFEPDKSVVVTVGTEGIALQLGHPPYRAKVEKADRILVEVRRRKAKPAVVFLEDDAHPERVVVRMR